MIRENRLEKVREVVNNVLNQSIEERRKFGYTHLYGVATLDNHQSFR